MAPVTEPRETVREFLSAHQAFDQLSDQILSAVIECLQAREVASGTAIVERRSKNDALWVMCTGAAEVRDRTGSLLARLGEGDSFGARSLERAGDAHSSVSAIEDTSLLCLPA